MTDQASMLQGTPRRASVDHVNFLGVTFKGPTIDDVEILDRVPVELQRFLQAVNGLIAYGGGLHIRGACSEPQWHSIRAAWEGPQAFHRCYPDVEPDDVPFAEDAVGDQWLLRDAGVLRLTAETGDTEDLEMTLAQFLAAVEATPIDTLALQPLMRFQAEGGQLQPGELLNVYPPFCTAEAAQGVHLAAVPTDERLRFLSQLAREMPPQGPFEVVVN